jgi:hypothetical protein
MSLQIAQANHAAAGIETADVWQRITQFQSGSREETPRVPRGSSGWAHAIFRRDRPPW